METHNNANAAERKKPRPLICGVIFLNKESIVRM